MLRTGVAYTLFGPNYSQIAAPDEVDALIRAAVLGVTAPLHRRRTA